MFDCVRCVQGCDVRAGEMPGGWRAVGGLYRLQYSHPFCENSLPQVVAVPMGQTLVFNGTHDNVTYLFPKCEYSLQFFAGVVNLFIFTPQLL